MNWFVDLGCAAAALFVALAMAGQAEESGRLTGDAQTVAFLIACVAVLALFARRRYPVGVAVLLAVLLAVTDLAVASALIAIFTVAAHRRWSVTAAVVGAVLVLYVPYSVARPDPSLNAFDLNMLNVALIAVAVAVGANAHHSREAAAALRERAARAGAQAALRAERLRAEERARMAHEMHDLLAHRMSLVSLYAGALEIRSDLPAEKVAEAAATIRTHAHAALEDLREILGVLRADPALEAQTIPHQTIPHQTIPDQAITTEQSSLTEQAVTPEQAVTCGQTAPTPRTSAVQITNALKPQADLTDVAALVADSRSAGTPVEIEDRLAGAEPPPLISRTAYRVVREGLTNARKHAPGRPVRLALDRAASGELHVWLVNALARPGTHATIPGAHAGLVGLGERVVRAGGRVDHGARRAADGTVAFHLEAWLPWPT